MKRLKELVFFTDNLFGKKLDFLEDKRFSMLSQLYLGTLEEEWNTDEEAAAFLYSSDASSSAYRKLKMILKRRLIQSLLNFDPATSENSDRQKAFFQSIKDLAAVKILMAKNARLVGVELCKKLLRNAIKYDFTSICCETSSMLRLHYGAMVGDTRKFEYYNQIFQKCKEMDQLENMAEEMYTELTMNYVNTRSDHKLYHKKAKKYYNRLAQNLETHGGYQLHLYGRLIQIGMYSSVNDYAGTIAACEKTISFFERKAYSTDSLLQIFYYQMLESYLVLKDFERSKPVIEKLNQYIRPGNFNWFKYQELYFILLMRTTQYQQAFELFEAVSVNKKFQFLPTHVLETWKIFEAYLSYLTKMNLIQIDNQGQYKFSMGKFLNEIQIFSKAKSGMNIAILIIQILNSILKKNHGKAAEQIESIQKYCKRYLIKNKETKRSYLFIKMLLEVPRCNFNRKAVMEKCKNYVLELKGMPGTKFNIDVNIEIITYETLWGMVVTSLDNTFRS